VSRVTAVVLASALAAALALASLASAAAPAGAAVLPAQLIALEQKMDELQITSIRFSEQTSVTLPNIKGGLGKLLRTFVLLLDTRESGEATLSPAAANLTVEIFGHPFEMRLVDGVTYLYIARLGAHDHGRPWIELGPNGFEELLTVNGRPVSSHEPHLFSNGPQRIEPTLAEPPFTKLQKALAGAREVSEAGQETIDGQPATRFVATLEPEQLRREALLSQEPAPLGHRRLTPPRQQPTVTMEVWLAQDGLPVRTEIVDRAGKSSASAILEIPAIDFPLTIDAPPLAQTVTLAHLRALERRERRRHHHAKK
jgi:hypothetical protein